MAIAVETKHLLLCPFTDADVDLVVELDSDPEVMQHLTYAVTRCERTRAEGHEG